jgi:hypothetical protein
MNASVPRFHSLSPGLGQPEAHTPPVFRLRVRGIAPASVRLTVVAAALGLAVGIQAQPLGEALNATHLTWTTGGDADWFGQSDESRDGEAAQSGGITDQQETWMETTLTGPGHLTFWWKVSSEQDFDFLQFSVDGALVAAISGETGWHHRSLGLPAGTRLLRWPYAKDSILNSGQDAGWLDEVSLEPAIAPQITDAPEDRSVNQGDSFTFLVAVSGLPEPGVQWRRNGVPISEAMGTSLRLTNLQPGDAGAYDVVVTNVAGAVTSTPVSLTVLVPALTEPVLRLRRSGAGSGLELVVAPDVEPGVLRILEGSTPQLLLSAPALWVETNMPVAEELRIPLPPAHASRFFRAMRLHQP